MKKTAIIFVFAFFLSSVKVLCQQEEKINEMESRVPALENFHEIIYPIWHTAYPMKDYAALRSYVTEVDSLSEKIFNSQLPGILRDKKEKWDKGIAIFRSSVREYENQAEGGNNDSLLIAAEKLHASYEMLVRIIRPVLKEVDQFHRVLYVIYHTYLPEKNYKKIILTGDKLVKNAEAIINAKLPKRFEVKKEKINSAARELLNSVKQLASLDENAQGSSIEAIVEDIHSKYQKLEEIF